ncbi:MAG TPA: potassium channel family protein [Ktedonobacterales bacterium]
MLILRIVAAIGAVLVLAGVLWDAFETVVLPRRISRRFRLARLYFRGTWGFWSALVRRVPSLARREAFLAIYGPLALLLLLAFWAILLIVGFAALLWGLGSPLAIANGAAANFGADLYFSGTTFLTLGLGDVTPMTSAARGITVVEVGTGFGMLALVIGYLPVLYQAFSRRETRISLLDAHAGSPPSAGALLLRHPPVTRARRLTSILSEWEDWSSDLLETHLSYPVLAYYRSQHENQSWVAALTMVMDACALVLTCGRGLVGEEQELLTEQAAFTFAMARHAAVDLAQVFHTSSIPTFTAYTPDTRLPSAERARLQVLFAEVGGVPEGVSDGELEGMVATLDELRALYEPYLEGMATFLLMALPPWVPEPGALDDWQTTADENTAPAIADLGPRRRSRTRGYAR